MRLLDKSYECFEKEDALRMLQGCINRVCVSNDALEIVRMLGFGCDYLSMLAQSRLLQLREREKGNNEKNENF